MPIPAYHAPYPRIQRDRRIPLSSARRRGNLTPARILSETQAPFQPPWPFVDEDDEF